MWFLSLNKKKEVQMQAQSASLYRKDAHAGSGGAWAQSKGGRDHASWTFCNDQPEGKQAEDRVPT